MLPLTWSGHETHSTADGRVGVSSLRSATSNSSKNNELCISTCADLARQSGSIVTEFNWEYYLLAACSLALVVVGLLAILSFML